MKIQLLRGTGRKFGVPMLMLPVLGWLLCLIGFAAFNNRNNYYRNLPSSPSQRSALFWFPHWCVIIVGPFVFLCSFLHLLIGKWFTGILTSFLTSLYLVCSGAVIHYWAVELFDNSYGLANTYSSQLGDRPRSDWLVDQYWGLWPLIEWIGALASALFLTFYMMMWPCFKTKRNYYGEEEYEEQEMEEGEWDEEGEYEEGEEKEEVDDGQEEEAPSAPAPTQ